MERAEKIRRNAKYEVWSIEIKNLGGSFNLRNIYELH